jgi:hypothetical protein
MASSSRIRVIHLGSGVRIRILTFYSSRIPDPGVKMAADPGSGSATLAKNTVVPSPRMRRRAEAAAWSARRQSPAAARTRSSWGPQQLGGGEGRMRRRRKGWSPRLPRPSGKSPLRARRTADRYTVGLGVTTFLVVCSSVGDP